VSTQDKKNPDERKPRPSPSTGEGADSALDALRKKRQEAPPPDSIPPEPARK
jgi:hypothetical protein